MIRIALADCMEWLASLEEGSLDAIVTDPPYGLGFMGKAWDAMPPGVEWARLCLRALKPGGHLVAFGGTRTAHRLVCAIEDAGFEIRDAIHWHYATGFPKSLDVSKAIDAAAGAERTEVIGRSARHGGGIVGNGTSYEIAPAVPTVYAPATPEAARWQGWGTALKPAIEPAVLARKPLAGTVAANVLEHGTGALNVDGCRFAPGDAAWVGPSQDHWGTGHPVVRKSDDRITYSTGSPLRGNGLAAGLPEGSRWPANLYACPKAPREERERGLGPDNMLCKCQDTRSAWDEEDRRASTPPGTDTPPRRDTTASTSTDGFEWLTSSSGNESTDQSPQGTKSTTSTKTSKTTASRTSNFSTQPPTSDFTPDANSETGCGGSPAESVASSSPSTESTGTYLAKDGHYTDAAAPATSPVLWRTSGVVKGLRVCSKCGKWDRQPNGSAAVDRDDGAHGLKSPRAGAGRTANGVWCVHPTVKPVRLMRWLVRLVTPPGGTVADPFMGSGTTAVAALLEGFRVIGCEREPEYHAIATARANHAERWPSSWSDTAPGSNAEADSEIERVEKMGQVSLFGGFRAQ